MIAKPLTRFLKDNAPPLQATPDALEAVEILKKKLFSAPILRSLNWKKPFLVFYRCIRRWKNCNISANG